MHLVMAVVVRYFHFKKITCYNTLLFVLSNPRLVSADGITNQQVVFKSQHNGVVLIKAKKTKNSKLNYKI
jgi:hypothetical protein